MPTEIEIKGPRYEVVYIAARKQMGIRDNRTGNCMRPATDDPRAECIEMNRLLDDDELYLDQIFGYMCN